ncbi:MAG: TonB-dependent receptor [Muribaculaceae bacterium]|nr:TonB-dependent receptor [Muribaculaceae bacterium]
MRKFKSVILSALCLTLSVGVYAEPASVAEPQQQSSNASIKVSGKIIDESGEGIPGAIVQVKGSSKGVITDFDGNYEIEVAPKSTLEISFLGMKSQSVQVTTSQNDLIVTLQEQTAELDEVTVVAFGKQKKASVIGAISTVTAEDLRSPVGQLSNNLAGKLAGVVQMQRSGAPGSTSEFWIRGISTFGNYSSPLILVDGVERSMDLVDPNDIATFSILKDATATALYGVRGANGIVVITTKRGAESRPKVNAKAEFGVTAPLRLAEMANTEEWIKYYNDITVDGSNRLAIQPSEAEKYLTGYDPDLYPSVDWIKTIFKNQASTSRVNLSVTGGTQSVRYYISGAYYHESSLFNMADKSRYDAQLDFSRLNFRANVDVNITSSTELGLSLGTIYKTKNNTTASMYEIYWQTLRTTPISTPTRFSTGEIARPAIGENPFNTLNNVGYAQDFDYTAQSLVTLTQDFSEFVTPGLKANIKVSWDANTGNTIKRSIWPVTYSAEGRDEEGNLILHKNNDGSDYMQFGQSGNWGSRSTNLEASLTYDRVFSDKHDVGAMILFTMRNKTLAFPGSYEQSFPYRNIGLAGRFTYNYDSRYFAEFNFGYNGSENFSPGKRFGFFPSFAIGYIISNESFWERLQPTWNMFKIKASYGTIGNDQIGGARRFAFNTTMNGGAYGYVFGEKVPSGISGIATGMPGNPDVQWERATKENVGVELGFFNGDLNILADVFYEKRDGIFILQNSIPSTVGQNVREYVNVGEMSNRGYEISVEYRKAVGDWFVSGRGNLTFNRNTYDYDDEPTPIWAYQSNIGQHYPRQAGLVALGLFQSEEEIANSPKQTFSQVRPGDIKYKDINGDGVIDQFDYITLGYTKNPELTYGIGGTVAWKGIDFSVFFQGVAHVTAFVTGQPLYGQSSNILHDGNIYKDVANNRWTLENPNPNALYPRLALSKVENNMQMSTFWQRDMSFLRLKNIELGYTLPRNLTMKAYLSSVRVYLQAVNLATWSKFKLWDPELTQESGIENYGQQYPQMMTGAVGLSISF